MLWFLSIGIAISLEIIWFCFEVALDIVSFTVYALLGFGQGCDWQDVLRYAYYHEVCKCNHGSLPSFEKAATHSRKRAHS